MPNFGHFQKDKNKSRKVHEVFEVVRYLYTGADFVPVVSASVYTMPAFIRFMDVRAGGLFLFPAVRYFTLEQKRMAEEAGIRQGIKNPDVLHPDFYGLSHREIISFYFPDESCSGS